MIAIGNKAGLVDSDVLLLPFDVTKVDSHQKHFDSVIRHFGKVTIDNNASLTFLYSCILILFS